ncbi:MAG: MATE family efflux transporter [Christensenellales bacterium]|jgi:putative MATE family efflux protein
MEKSAELMIHREVFDEDAVSRRDIDRDVLRVALPTMAEMTLSAGCQLVDTIMVSSLGTWALAAVGLSAQPRFVLLVLCMGINVGFTALVARMRGEGDRAGMNAVLRQALLVSAVLSVALAVAGGLLSRRAMVWMGAQPDTIDGAAEYFYIQMLFFPAQILGLAIAACLRGAGHTRAAMMMNLASNAVNIPLNYLLIFGKWGLPAMGVGGASLATGISYLVALAMGIAIVAAGRYEFVLRLRARWRPDWGLLRRILRVGFPALLEQMVMRMGVLLFTRIISSLGTVAYATHQAGQSLLNITFMNGQAFSVAATTLVGQSLGRKLPGMARRYAASARNMTLLVSAILCAGLMVWGGSLIDLLFSDDPEVIALGHRVMQVMALAQPLMAYCFVTVGALRGAGYTLGPMIATAVGVLLIRPAASAYVVFALRGDLPFVWMTLIADYLVRGLILLWIFLRGTWVKGKV